MQLISFISYQFESLYDGITDFSFSVQVSKEAKNAVYFKNLFLLFVDYDDIGNQSF